MGDCVQIVGVVVGIGILHVHRVLFQLHKQQRNPVAKTYNIGAATVEVTVDFQLFDVQKVVVVRVLKINNFCSFFFRSATGTLDDDRNPISDKVVFFLVDLDQGGGGKMLLYLFLGFVQLGRGEPRVQPLEGLPKIPGEQNFMVAYPTKVAVLAQLFRVIGKGHLSAQLPLQQVTDAFLHKDIFGVVVAHTVPPYFVLILKSQYLVNFIYKRRTFSNSSIAPQFFIFFINIRFGFVYDFICHYR